MEKIKVLVVDDSAIFRSQIQLALNGHEHIEVVGSASNGKIALDKAAVYDVDLMVLDLEMPVMDGVETLKQIKEKNLKTKVILFSSVGAASVEKTFEGLNLGAMDFVAKPVADNSNFTPDEKIRRSLLPKILSLFPARTTATIIRNEVPHMPPTQINLDSFRPDILVIASSTGGPNALAEFFKYLTAPIPFPVLITQHMPPVFTASLAQRIAGVCGHPCAEAKSGEVLRANHLYVAPGDFHMSLSGTKNETKIVLNQDEARNFVRPCADFLFESASRIYGPKTLGIVFTGMGKDGCDGSRMIKSHQGAVMIQDQSSSVVFGMPGAVFDAKAYDFIGNPEDLAKKVIRMAFNKGVHNVA